VGLYRTEEGTPYVFPAVAKAEQRIVQRQLAKDYLPMIGYAPFLERARELLWGQSIIKEMGSRIGTIQSCAGTGALFLVSQFVTKKIQVPRVLLSDPSWPSHRLIFGEAGCEISYYPWAKDGRLDQMNMLSAFHEAPEGSLVVLQVVGHNPTGIDPTLEQWREIFEAIGARKHIVCFDFAYLGFGSVDPDTDAQPVREYAKMGREFFVAFSFSKCMGLYAERIGCLHVVANAPEQVKIVESQLMRLGRHTWSNCPQNGALIVTEVLGDPELKAEWLIQLKEISQRILKVRGKLCDELERLTGKPWDFARKQQGMFMLTGLTKSQVEHLGNDQGVFLPTDGRLSVPALNDGNVGFVAQAIANVVGKA
jgi:aspartate/tyrosine/aromatic aminotransferase